jgi:hypothetical protein
VQRRRLALVEALRRGLALANAADLAAAQVGMLAPSPPPRIAGVSTAVRC